MKYLSNQTKVVVIIGPSGAGKSSAIQELVKRSLIEVTPSWTTRPIRPDEEKTSVEHVFVSQQEFEKAQKVHQFIDVVHMFNLPYIYGLPKIEEPNNKIPLVMLRVVLIGKMRSHYSNLLIYQIEDDYKRVEERLLNRVSDKSELGTRLKDYNLEIEAGSKIADRTFTNDSDIFSLADKIEKALKSDYKK